MIKLTNIALALAVLIISASAATWTGSVKTDADKWSITRESSNVSFTYEQSVVGQISSVDFRGRTLQPYHSLYEDVEFNDVRVKERTAALQGSYSSEELLSLRSSINNSVNMSLFKPYGSDLYTIEFYEKWPVCLSYNKSMNYSGRGINNREAVGNNRDFIAANFLYNNEFSKERDLKMDLKRMNATILATDEFIDLADIKATRETKYNLQSHSTGIMNFKYRQVGDEDEVLNEGDESFTGTFDVSKNIRMKSQFDLIQEWDGWLPCCSGGYAEMNPKDAAVFKSARGIFDCTCFEVSSKSNI